jgi:hypothetical protein
MMTTNQPTNKEYTRKKKKVFLSEYSICCHRRAIDQFQLMALTSFCFTHARVVPPFDYMYIYVCVSVNTNYSNKWQVVVNTNGTRPIY